MTSNIQHYIAGALLFLQLLVHGSELTDIVDRLDCFPEVKKTYNI